MRNTAGHLVPLVERAEAIANYLETEHWFNPPEGPPRTINNRPISTAPETHESETERQQFTMNEFNEAFKKAKTGKEPGPDSIRMELLAWLSLQNRELLLATINGWWTKKTITERALSC